MEDGGDFQGYSVDPQSGEIFLQKQKQEKRDKVLEGLLKEESLLDKVKKWFI